MWLYRTSRRAMERMKLVVWKDTLMTNLASRAWILLSLKVALTFWSHYFSLWRIKLFCLDVDLRRLKESFTSISKNELSPGLATHYSTPIKTKWSTLISLRLGINEKKRQNSAVFWRKNLKSRYLRSSTHGWKWRSLKLFFTSSVWTIFARVVLPEIGWLQNVW